MRSVDVHPHAWEDLKELRATNKPAAAAILVALEQIKADPNVIDKMTTHGNNCVGVAQINVKRWEKARGMGNFWRFRVLDTPATSYRILYGYQWQTRQLCVLAVVSKENFDYDDLSTDTAKRILEDWRAL